MLKGEVKRIPPEWLWMPGREESSAFVNTSLFSDSLFKGLKCGADTSGGEGAFVVNPTVLSVWAEVS